MFAIFKHAPQTRHYLLMICIAFCIRAVVFSCYIRHEERYCQSDSMDYHVAALCLTHKYGMHYSTGRPIFWRTPGYPLFLSYFYQPICSGAFDAHAPDHYAALWCQIVVCSLIPVAVSVLALVLTSSSLIAWIAAGVSIVHTGFVLSSTFLLTDGLATLFFLLFLIFFFMICVYPHQQKLFSKKHEFVHQPRYLYSIAVGAALTLSAYTWMRPMGQFIGIVAASLLCATQYEWKKKLRCIGLFLCVFCASLAPWFVRNYRITGELFFCPLFGLYLNAFNAPKILARTAQIPLKEAHTRMEQRAEAVQRAALLKAQVAGNKKRLCGENLCLQSALPVIREHPGYFMYDWIVEVLKTTFDLYAYQLVALANNCFKWDPLIEYLPEKWRDCLYAKPLPLFFRLLAWIEAVVMLCMWMGILAGVWYFMVSPLLYGMWNVWYAYGYLWLKAGIIMALFVGQSGGFGYARLRLPIEALLIILALTFWVWLLYDKRTGEQS